MVLLDVKATLFHEDIERSLILFSKVDRRFWHILINNLREQVDVSGSVVKNSVYKIGIARSTKELFNVIEFNSDEFELFVCYFLL